MKQIFRLYCIYSIAALAVISIYYWFAYRSFVPAQVAGTAADPFTFMDTAQAERSRQYSMLRDILFFAGYAWEWGILLWLIASGAARQAVDRFANRFTSYIPQFTFYIAWLAAVTFVLSLPLKLISYGLSRNYGISTASFPVWAKDQAISLGLDFVMLLSVGAVVFFFIRRGGSWWFRLWLLSIPFLLFLMLIQPILIDPLFYRYEPLADTHLKQSILEMTEEAGIPTERIFQANYSEKTNAINAYVDGIGPSLRIVIWDTALQKLSEPEILVLTAHEMAHYVKHHLQWSAVGSIGGALVLLWAGAKIYNCIFRRYGSRLSLRQQGDWAALPLLLLLLSVLSFASTPIMSAVSRSSEAAADRYAYELTGRTEAAVTMYQKLALSSRGIMFPPALTYWFRYTHPSLGERIEEALHYEQTLR